MNRTSRSPLIAFVALILSLCFTPITSNAAAKKKAPQPAAKASKQEKSARDRSAKKKKESARESRAERGGRGAEKSRHDRRSAKEERRSKSREEKRAAARDEDRGSKKKGSRRERLAEARREAERRRREEAARRAEIARQAAIARALAIARQRAADQALKDETSANILQDNLTGEDAEVRRVALNALAGHAGSVVVMDPKTGRVYTIVNQEWALRRGNVPCSTIKLVTGVAGLSEKVIDPVQTVNISVGSYRLDLTDSLAFSNNIYFQKVGGYVGFDKMMSYARQFGLGERTGVNHPNESPGRLPVFKSGYAVNHMSSHGDDIEVTTIQLANMASAIANGGSLLVPHLPRTPEETYQFKTEVRRRLDVPEEHLRRVIPGMIGAVSYGTGRGANDPLQTVAGKTGTCSGQGSRVGLFTSYAPVHDPRLAVAVITRGSGEKGRTAAAVAGRIYRALNGRFGVRGDAPMIANQIQAPRPKIDPRAAAAISDEDREAAEGDAFVVSEATDAAAGQSRNGYNSNTKLTSQPAQTRPTGVVMRPGVQPLPPASSSPSSSPAQRNGAERPRRVLETNPAP